MSFQKALQDHEGILVRIIPDKLFDRLLSLSITEYQESNLIHEKLQQYDLTRKIQRIESFIPSRLAFHALTTYSQLL